MKPEEKAKELIDKFSNHCFDFEKHKEDNEYSAKQCALIAVDELIYETKFEFPNIRQRYWIEVKQEIEKI